MKKLISLPHTKSLAEFNETYDDYEATRSCIADTVCYIRSPSGTLSCGTFIGYNGRFFALKGAMHAQDAPFRSLDYNHLRSFLAETFSFTRSQIETVGHYLEAHNCTFIPIFEGEENPILKKVDLGQDFPFPNIKTALESWLKDIPEIVQCEVRFQENRYFAQENGFYLNRLVRASQAANERIDSIDLVVHQPIPGSQGLLPYDLSYGLDVNQPLYIPVIRSHAITILEARIHHDAARKSLIQYGSIHGGAQLNYILVDGSLLPGDSGAPVIIEKYGKIFYLGSVRSLDKHFRGVIPIWGQAEDAALFADHDTDMIQAQGSHKSNIEVEYPLGDYYAYGNGKTTPHIHCYAGGFHLKILTDRNKIERFDIVKDGKFLEKNLTEVLSALETNDYPLNEAEKQPLKTALLGQVTKYGFTYEEEPNDFRNLDEFRAFLNARKSHI